MNDENSQSTNPSVNGNEGKIPSPPLPSPPSPLPPSQNQGDADGTQVQTQSGDAKAKPNSPLQSDDELSEDQFVTGGDDHSFITSIPVPAHPSTQFDEKKFLELLAKSISLTKTEKQRIITSITKLSQYQIDELMRIFEEEQKKFSELNQKHENQLKAIEDKHKDDWSDIEMQSKQDEKKKKDDDEATKLRKQMGL